jgi:hypothetical protein
MIVLTHSYGLSAEPFLQKMSVDKLFPLPGLKGFLQRFDLAPTGTEKVGNMRFVAAMDDNRTSKKAATL